MAKPLLEVRNLCVQFSPGVNVLDKLSFSLDRGETLGIVGESGCGKTLAVSALVGLLPPGGRITGGQILFEGQDLSRLNPKQLRSLRGRRISMIFQHSAASLNPVYRIGTQMRETLRLHQKLSPGEETRVCAEALRRVGLSMPETRLRQFPHQLSSGQCQRVMIALALLSTSSLLIADEPVSALDVTVRPQILGLLRTFRQETGASIVLISHDMGAVAGNADKVLVMYAGRPAEYGDAKAVLSAPLHPCTRSLLSCVPRSDRDTVFPPMEGAPPSLDALPAGCRFAPRCPRRQAVCQAQRPPRITRGGRTVYCHLPMWPGEGI